MFIEMHGIYLLTYIVCVYWRLCLFVILCALLHVKHNDYIYLCVLRCSMRISLSLPACLPGCLPAFMHVCNACECVRCVMWRLACPLFVWPWLDIRDCMQWIISANGFFFGWMCATEIVNCVAATTNKEIYCIVLDNILLRLLVCFFFFLSLCLSLSLYFCVANQKKKHSVCVFCCCCCSSAIQGAPLAHTDHAIFYR